MHSNIVMLCVSLLIIRRSICTEKCKPKIAIIGAGIGGASASHFLTELFNNNLNIDLFEANKIGGRLATIEINKNKYEAGGSVIHARNKYMQYFLKLLGMERTPTGDGQRTGIWNGSKFVFEESTWMAITLSKLIYRYGFQPFKLMKYIYSILDDFDKIYTLQDKNVFFNDTSDLLLAMNNEFPKLLQISIKDHLENVGYSSQVINELVEATMVVNYGQDTNIHSFVGFVSLAGVDSNLWSVKGGNKEIPKHLIYRNGKVNVIPSQVQTIRYLANNTFSQYEITYHNPDSINTMSGLYDIVIIATPLTRDHEMPIAFIDFPENIDFMFPGNYQTTVATFLKGDLNPYHFGLEEQHNLDSIFSCNPDKTKISSIGKLSTVDGLFNKSQQATWKIFSRESLTLPYLNRVFSHVSDVKEKVWKAYPHYTTEMRRDKFKLHNFLYHVNAVEWVASAMEMSVIGGRNVAIMAHNDFHQKCLLSTEQNEKVEVRRTEL